MQKQVAPPTLKRLEELVTQLEAVHQEARQRTPSVLLTAEEQARAKEVAKQREGMSGWWGPIGPLEDWERKLEAAEEAPKAKLEEVREAVEAYDSVRPGELLGPGEGWRDVIGHAVGAIPFWEFPPEAVIGNLRRRLEIAKGLRAGGQDVKGRRLQRGVKAPTELQKQIAKAYEGTGMTEAQVADAVSEVTKKRVSQTDVSRAIGAVNRWRKAQDPPLPKIKTRRRGQIATVDPEAIALGKRGDGLAHRQRRGMGR